MSSLVILALLGIALLTGPTAFLLIWLTYRKTGEHSLRTLAFSLLGLCFIVLANSTTFILENFTRTRDARIAFVIMNAAFISTIMMGAFLLRFAHEVTGTAITSTRRTLFLIFTVLFFFLVISLPIFLISGVVVNVRHGYLASTLYGAFCHAFATELLVSRRAELPAIYRPALPWIFTALLVLAAVSVMNDIVHFGPIFGGPDVPFSPFFFILMNFVIVVLCVKTLLNANGGMKLEAAIIDFGFTEREREIVPLLVDGLSNDDIAEKLFISPHTVKNHVTSIFRKANVAGRFELLKRLGNSE